MNDKRKLYIAAAVLLVLVVALGLLTACSSDSLVEYEAPAVSTAPTTYTLTVQASKGEAVTKALSLDSGVLNASWAEGDEVKVYDANETVLGILKAASSGAETMLKGEVSNVAVNEELTLKFLSPSYANQGGTLDYIAANCDYATASVTVLGINGTDITTTGAVFENQQAIVKFTIENNFTATEMMVVADGNTYAIHSATALSEFFVALPSFSEKDIHVTAANGSDIYTFVKENITIASGKYYTLTMQMNKVEERLVDLSTLTGNYKAQNGDILTGTIDNSYKISIADGASITLSDVSINASGAYAGITCLGNATITLVGTNVVNGCEDDYPGIQAGPKNTTLTINGTGSLTATGGYYAAGIGSGSANDCGDISISGGTITATGGMFAAGIGSGLGTICGDISISGGTITATGGYQAAGIGSGDIATCGNISISGGTITATGGDRSAGIGSGIDGTCDNITINSTASGTATGGNGSPYDIGYGLNGTCGIVSVESNNFSGTHPVSTTLVACTFTVNFQTNGNLVKTDKITINCEGKNYTALSTDEVNTYIRNESVVKADLPVGANLSLTFTAECITLNGSTPAGTYSATLTDVTITEGSENNLGTVNFVKQ